MVNPQKENGFTPIAHELFQAFYSCKMTEYERVIVMHLWRKTYGWDKKEDWISNSQFSEETGVPRPHVTRTLNELKRKKIVTSSGNKLSVNKHYDNWEVEWRKLPHQVTRVTSSGNKKLPDQVPTIERKKETIERGETSSLSGDLKTNKNDMGWNNKSDDFEEGVVDLDGDGKIYDPAAEADKNNKAQNARKRELVDWLITYQKRDPARTNRPKQIKALNRLIEMKVTGAEAQQIIMEQMQTEFWAGKKEKPDFCTVVALIEKRGE
jgi:phage replication O-like protein O